MPRFDLSLRSHILCASDHLRVTASSRVTGKNTPSGPGSGRQLGRELRKLRKAARLTQVEAARSLGYGQAKITKIEHSTLRVSAEDLEQMLTVYQASPEQAEVLRQLRENQRARRSADTPRLWPAYEEFTDWEMNARSVLAWHSEGIPVILRSEPYMLRGVRNHPGTPEQVIELLRRRKARTKVLFTDGPLDYQIILSESALLRMPGGHCPDLVVEQVEHMINLVHKSKLLTVRVLPFNAPLDFVDSDFVLLRFPPAAGMKDFAYIEYVSGARNISAPREVDRFEEHWNRLRDAALSPDDSLEFMAAAAQRAVENKESITIQ